MHQHYQLPSPEPANIDEESYQESEDEQAAEIAHQVWSGHLL